jgi:hypothetical protein
MVPLYSIGGKSGTIFQAPGISADAALGDLEMVNIARSKAAASTLH